MKTPEQWADEVRLELIRENARSRNHISFVLGSNAIIAAAITKAIEEREACAKVRDEESVEQMAESLRASTWLTVPLEIMVKIVRDAVRNEVVPEVVAAVRSILAEERRNP